MGSVLPKVLVGVGDIVRVVVGVLVDNVFFFVVFVGTQNINGMSFVIGKIIAGSGGKVSISNDVEGASMLGGTQSIYIKLRILAFKMQGFGDFVVVGSHIGCFIVCTGLFCLLIIVGSDEVIFAKSVFGKIVRREILCRNIAFRVLRFFTVNNC